MAKKEDVVNETAEELVEWGLTIENSLTDWEVEFLEDMEKRLKQGFSITSKQRTKLEEIITDKG